MTRVLFVHQNFPGQFKHLAREMSGWPGFEVLCLGDAANLKKSPPGPGYKLLGYVARPRRKTTSHHYLGDFETAIRRGQDVVRALKQLRAHGFVPDLVIGHPGWGELLFVKDEFPNAKLIAYFEYFYRFEGGDVGFDPEFKPGRDARFKARIRNSAQLHALSACEAGISPTIWQRSTYPAYEQSRIRIIHEGFDCDALRPNAEASFILPDGRRLTRNDIVVSYVSRRLEPYRGFHVFMRALPDLQRRLPNAQFVVIGADGVCYGAPPRPPFKSYREMLMQEVGSRLDMSRVHFVGWQPYQNYCALLQITRLHLYWTYPFVLSWSMLEAMACGAPVLASSTPPVVEVIRDGENGFTFDFFDREALVERASAILHDDVEPVRRAARHLIETRYSFRKKALPVYTGLIGEVLSAPK